MGSPDRTGTQPGFPYRIALILLVATTWLAALTPGQETSPEEALEADSLPPSGSLLCGGVDPDGDGVGSDCDNCLAIYNPGQDDADIDGAGDDCDCAPLNAGTSSLPGEATNFRVSSDGETLLWDSAALSGGPGTVHDVVRGDLAQMPVGSGPSEICLAFGIPAATTSDTNDPLPGRGYWYLARGRNTCGAGIYGLRSNGTVSASGACPFVPLADLVETTLTNPPIEIDVGGSFSVTDTTLNQGAAASAISTVRYYLSLDHLKDGADVLLTGTRAVASLSPGQSSTGTTSVSVSSNTAAGTFYLLACADDTGSVGESDETNNCRSSVGQVVVRTPDLTQTAVSDPPAAAATGLSFSVTDTVQNAGDAGAGASSTRYYLSLDTVMDGVDILLAGARSVPSLAGGATSTDSATVTIPVAATIGSYHLLACADDLNTVIEDDETNNCLSSTGLMELRRPDLTETSVISPPASITVGSIIPVSDTVQNVGTGGVGISTSTRFYLSSDTVKDVGDKLLTGSRTVPPLAASGSSSGGSSVTIPASAALGTQYLLACADDLGAIAENSETNNCIASTNTTQVVASDLVETALTNPPASVSPGTSFSVTDTVQNTGSGGAGSSSTRYYLSVDTVKDAADVVLSGSRNLLPLGAGATSSGTLTVTVPTSAVAGTYYLLACADDLLQVTEIDETNNCRASVGQTQVILPDLTETAVSNPPASISPGLDFSVTDTAQNIGTVTAAGTTTRYYLSLDTIKDGADLLLSGQRGIASLASGASSTGTVTVTVAASTAGGTYYLLACANDFLPIGETNLANNCLASTGQVQVVVTADMIETAVSDPPAATGPNQSFAVTDTAQNVGSGATGVSTTTRYYFSVDTVKDGTDTLLSGARGIGVLTAGATSTGGATVTVPGGTVAGTYYLIACADDLNSLSEISETNNCVASVGQTQVALPDLVETALSDPPASVSLGGPISVTDTVENTGPGPAGPSTTSYYLSLDTVKDGTDVALSGGRSVPQLSAGGSSTGMANLSVLLNTAAGTYYVLACADGSFMGGMIETDETNNCRASAGQVQVILGDLVQTSVSDPPASLAPGSGFSVTDTAQNLGPGSVASSTTRYYLSLDQLKDAGDTLLSGSRGLPPLASGATSTGTTPVTIPTGTDTFLYFLLACADDQGTVQETNETNNCVASSGKVQVILLPDLVETGVSSPPAAAAGGLSFPVTDTAQNVGLGSAGASLTRYYLSLNTVKDGADILLVGIRSVPGLSGSASSTGSLSLSIPSAVAAGTYFVLACADDTAVIVESNELNNCSASTSTMQIRQSDLVSSVSGLPPSTTSGGSFSATDLALNQGSSAAGPSTTRCYLSLDAIKDAGDILLGGTRTVQALVVGASSSATVPHTVPSSTALGTYYVFACVDDLGAVAESDETNNCQRSSTQILVVSIDLVETTLTNPPASTSPGSGFSVTDTVQNTGTGSIGTTSSTRYYLSVDTVKDLSDVVLSGSRTVPPLGAGATSLGTVTVTVPTSAAAGTYYLLACADELLQVSETDETNNCRASVGQTQIILPDLTETAVSDPPASISPGSGFSVTDTVQNVGTVTAAGTNTRYYLSLNTVKDGTDLLLSGQRAITSLAASASSTGTVTVTVAANTAGGTYYLLACANDFLPIGETDLTNNCRASAGQVQVVVTADMTETAVNDPPASVSAGGSFSVTDTAQNVGSGATGVSTTTRYYISVDTVRDGTDTLLNGQRAIGSLAAGATSTGGATVAVPVGTALGTYYLIACADDLNALAEISETNNCLTSVGQTQVALPDLVETALSDPPASVSPGGLLSVTDTVQNTGAGPAGSSTTSYYLSLDTVKDGTDVALGGVRSIPPLSAGGSSTGMAGLNVATSTAAGTYYVLACADTGGMGGVTESDETNNCRASVGQTQIILPDLTETAVNDPPASLAAGSGFSVTDTAQNLGPGSSAISTTRYYLSLDQLKDSGDTLLSGSRGVPPLASGATSTGTTTVTIPNGTDAFLYFILACADDQAVIQETSETNNCVASVNRVSVTKPDLVETAVSNPPASVTAGNSFSVTDTALNQGTAAAGASTTRYYLSADTSKSFTDILLSGSRGIISLAISGTSTGTVTIGVPLGTAPGTYYLLACADDTATVLELLETNNCLASAGQVIVN